MRTPMRALVATTAIGLAVIVSGCGGGKGPSVASGANRSIDVTMTDNAFQPNTLRVTKGDTVTVKFKNNGSVTHEAILGDDAAQTKHHAEMTASTSQMEHGNANHEAKAGSADAITVEPGPVSYTHLTLPTIYSV